LRPNTSKAAARAAAQAIAKAGFAGLTIQKTSTADQVAGLLRERILRGELRPGTPLREVLLAGSIGVSRNTLREALRILIQEGLVLHTVHRGITVMQLTTEAVADIYQVRQMLEIRAVETGKPNEAQIASLYDAVDRLEEAAKAQDWPGVFESDMLFHRRLVALLGSERLEAFYGNLLGELRLGLVEVDRASRDVKRSRAEHRRVADLLAAGNRRECARLLTEHLMEAEKLVTAVVAAEVSARD
jgi:DNA-binding GntR family transcriptional regulator